MKRTHHIKLLVAVTVVLLTLSGFSPNRSSGGRGGSSSGGSKVHSGGGGCSSKNSSSHSGSSDYGSSSGSTSSGSTSGGSSSSSDDYSSSSGSGGGYRGGTRYNSTTSSGNSDSSSGGSGSSRRHGSGSVIKCADRLAPSATVRVRNTTSRQATYTVSVKFVDDLGTTVDTGSALVTLAANGSKSVKVPMSNPSEVGDVDRCEVVSVR